MSGSNNGGTAAPHDGEAVLYVHSTESFGSVDGPGVRFVIFLRGCHMRCRYCHNPDTWRMASDSDKATTVSQLLDMAERYRAYWGSDGGITVSGGEARLCCRLMPSSVSSRRLTDGASTRVSTLPDSHLRGASLSMASSYG